MLQNQRRMEVFEAQQAWNKLRKRWMDTCFSELDVPAAVRETNAFAAHVSDLVRTRRGPAADESDGEGEGEDTFDTEAVVGTTEGAMERGILDGLVRDVGALVEQLPLLERMGTTPFRPAHWAQLFDALDFGLARKAKSAMLGGGSSRNIMVALDRGGSRAKPKGGSNRLLGGLKGAVSESKQRHKALVVGGKPWTRGEARASAKRVGPKPSAAGAPTPAGAPSKSGGKGGGGGKDVGDNTAMLAAAEQMGAALRLDELVKGGLFEVENRRAVTAVCEVAEGEAAHRARVEAIEEAWRKRTLTLVSRGAIRVGGMEEEARLSFAFAYSCPSMPPPRPLTHALLPSRPTPNPTPSPGDGSLTAATCPGRSAPIRP